MNTLCAVNKLPMQRGFFKTSMGDLLPALRFLGRLYNFCILYLYFLYSNITTIALFILRLKTSNNLQFKYKNDKKQYFTEMLKN